MLHALPVLALLAICQWLADIKEAGSLICAYKPMTGNGVVERCQELGLAIVGGSETGNWVACDWEGELDCNKVSTLARDERVRFVEPNYWDIELLVE